MTTTIHDPICTMAIGPSPAAGASEYNGQTYYFCSPSCKKVFDKASAKFLGEANKQES